MISRALFSLAVAALAWGSHTAGLAEADGGQGAPASTQSGCRVTGEVVRLPDLPEGSGIAASRRHPGVLWAHNDSGDPLIFALNEQGKVTGRVRLNGAEVDDWEDIAV